MPARGSKVYPKMITRRERAMLNLIAQGYRNEEIAGELYISEKNGNGKPDESHEKIECSECSIRN